MVFNFFKKKEYLKSKKKKKNEFRHRMRGETVLWNPGCDHAGIATQVIFYLINSFLFWK